MAKEPRTHCKLGHKLTPSNLVSRKDKRECRLCHARRQRDYEARKRERLFQDRLLIEAVFGPRDIFPDAFESFADD